MFETGKQQLRMTSKQLLRQHERETNNDRAYSHCYEASLQNQEPNSFFLFVHKVLACDQSCSVQNLLISDDTASRNSRVSVSNWWMHESETHHHSGTCWETWWWPEGGLRDCTPDSALSAHRHSFSSGSSHSSECESSNSTRRFH